MHECIRINILSYIRITMRNMPLLFNAPISKMGERLVINIPKALYPLIEHENLVGKELVVEVKKKDV
jgi:hypothetical protein